jgi:hypothetical protein
VNRKTCILLTATVNPAGPMVVQSNPQLRLSEYEQVLNFYAETLPQDIVLAENSDFDPAQSRVIQQHIRSGRVRFIAAPASTHPEKGKGYQEFEMLDRVVAQLADEYDSFVKITGRYHVTNAAQLIAEWPAGVRIDRHRKMKVAITGFFHCRIDFYQKHLRGTFREADDEKGVFIEHVLYNKLAQLPGDQVQLFHQNPDYRGVSGSHGNSMQRHPLKMKLRNAERKLLKMAGKQEFLIEY